MTLVAVPTKNMTPTERIRAYNQSLYNLDSAIRTVDSTLNAMRAGQKPDWRQVAQETGVQLDAAMSWLNTLTHTGLGDFDVPIPTPTSDFPTMGPNAALTPQGMTLPSAYSEGGPQLTTLAARLRTAKYLILQRRDAERVALLRQDAGLGMLTDCFGQPDPSTPAQRRAFEQRMRQHEAGLGTFDPTGAIIDKYAGILAIRAALAAACAYHGYGRNGTVGGAIKWALWPLLFGFTGGGVALAIAAKQGYGKPLPKPTT
jgi:hypothetical protein